jgi:eukaryotic-like serine/threonine-protein kinase
MATVFWSLDLRHDRPVALKVLHPELAASLGPERFLREIKIAARLQHPHILPIHDSGEIQPERSEGPTLLWYTMPFVEGESLRDRLRRQVQLPVETGLRLICEIALAIDYAHRHGVVHRDVKPENILLSDDQALVADFGVARALDQSTVGKLTETGIALGTPAYMSPEQASGGPVDGRSDLYSLATVLYEILAGEPPYTGPTAQAIVTKRLMNPIPSIRQGRPAVSAELDAVVTRALATVPADRFATGAELVQALRAVSATSGSVSMESRLQTRSPARRSFRPALLAALGIVTVSGLGYVILDRYETQQAAHGAAASPSTSGFRPDSVAGTPGRSIGVLPLVNLSGDPGAEYFSDGMTDELTGALSKVRGLRVASRTSAFTFKGRKDMDVRQIGEKLKVAAVLEGSVRRVGSRVRLTAQLTSVGDGLTLWSETYERDLTGLFQVQAEIAQSIAQALQLTFTGGERRQFSTPATQDVRAHDLYLRGRFFLDRSTEKDIRRGMQLLQAALAEDSTYAAAYGEIARGWMNLADDFIAPKEAWPQVRAAAGSALELDSTLADAHTFLGAALQWYEKDLRGAERELQRAIKLNPNDANARFNLGRLLVLTDRTEEGLVEYRNAVVLDPLSALWRYGLAEALVWTDSLDAALAVVREALEVDPNIGITHEVLGHIHFAKGELAQAASAYRRAEELGWTKASFGRALVYARSGQPDSARRIAQRWEREAARRWVAPDLIAGIYATLGERDKAFQLLEHAYEERAGYLLMLHVRADLIPLRGDPRFAALARKLGLAG